MPKRKLVEEKIRVIWAIPNTKKKRLIFIERFFFDDFRDKFYDFALPRRALCLISCRLSASTAISIDASKDF